jgi:hypothetical protein
VRHILRVDSTGHLPQPIVVGPEVSDELRLLTYQNRLRVIGRELDVGDFRAISIWEVGGGFLVRGTQPNRRSPEALDFLDRDFQQLVAVTARGDGERRQRPGALLPTGYEDMLRAIGKRLDEQISESVALSELTQSVVVWGLAKVDAAVHVAPMPFEWVFDEDDIGQILDDAYRRRTDTPAPPPGLLRRLARS